MELSDPMSTAEQIYDRKMTIRNTPSLGPSRTPTSQAPKQIRTFTLDKSPSLSPEKPEMNQMKILPDLRIETLPSLPHFYEAEDETKKKLSYNVPRLFLNLLHVQHFFNFLRALPMFIFEDYAKMALTFIVFIGLVSGRYALKKMSISFIVVYIFGTIIAIVNCSLVFRGLVEDNSIYDSKEVRSRFFYMYYILNGLTLCASFAGFVLSCHLWVLVSFATVDEILSLSHLLLNETIFFSEEKYTPIKSSNLNALSHRVVIHDPSNDSTYIDKKSSWNDWIEENLRILPVSGDKHADNIVRKAKYNFATFLPKFLFEQFSRLANLYTLCIVSLSFASFSPVSPVSSITPLCIVLSVSAIKEIREDYRRRSEDLESNSRPTRYLKPIRFKKPITDPNTKVELSAVAERSSDLNEITVSRNSITPVFKKELSTSLSFEFRDCKWLNLRTGSIVLIRSDEVFPADFVLLTSSDENSRCFIETSSLDGETNLKIRQCLNETSKFTEVEDFTRYIYSITCELPNNRLYQFDGSLELSNISTGASISVPIKADNILLRGTKLRHTEWVVGIVVNAGIDTKIEKNATVMQSKKSSVELNVNSQLVIIFILQCIFCLIASIGNQEWIKSNTTKFNQGKEELPWYLGFNLPVGYQYIYIAYLIMLNSMIPLSMYVSMEMVRYYNGRLITEDKELRVAISGISKKKSKLPSDFAESNNSNEINILPQDVVQSLARNASVVEDLGRVSYVFSDKTGTLTRNEMSFTACYIGNWIYGPSSLHDEHRINFNSSNQDKLIEPLIDFSIQSLGVPSSFCDKLLLHHYSSKNDNCHLIEEFLLIMALCNTVTPDYHLAGDVDLDKNPNIQINTVEFQACSPDESALVIGAKALGFELKSRNGNIVVISVFGEMRTYEILYTLDFNSVRKRMSVICMCPDGIIRLFCKGADATVLPRVCNLDSCNKVNSFLNSFATEGLRTLCFASSILGASEFGSWEKLYKDSEKLLENRQDKLDDLAEEIEKNMTLVGCSAIEDRLQENVYEAITTMREAGIKVWVLTGDKLETAVSIGHSCGVLSDEMEIITMKETDGFSLMQRLDNNGAIIFTRPRGITQKTVTEFFTGVEEYEVEPNSISSRKRALVIDGPTLFLALEPDFAFKFIALAKTCVSVICCRCTPLQKGAVIDAVTEYSILENGVITLAIGDGANDVPMIQKANVGIGINDGKEGMQAALASDFSIPRFSMIIPLLLKYGHRAYKRISKLVLYSFAKNFALCLPSFCFAFVNAKSGQMFYFDFLFTLYNSLFTFFPIVQIAFDDVELSDKMLYGIPPLYRHGIDNLSFGIWNFVGWILIGFWSALIVFGSGFITDITGVGPDGKEQGMWVGGACAYMCLIFGMTSLVCLVNSSYSKSNLYSCLLGIFLVFVSIFLYSAFLVWVPEAYNVASMLCSLPSFWIILIAATVLIPLPYYIYRVIEELFFPDFTMNVRFRLTEKSEDDVISEYNSSKILYT